MQKFLTLLFLFISLEASSQLIKGKVIIYEKDEPLSNANVFYDGMYKGAVTDENGNFTLAAAPSNQIPIIISAIGYHSTSISNYQPGEFLTVYLQPRVYALDPVVFTDDGMSRTEKENVFTREFIGVSENSKDCRILNIDDVRLVFNKKRQMLEAFADEPIIFENRALGFRVTYHLAGFSYSPGRIFFAGNYFFEPDSTLSDDQLEYVKNKRKQAYLGSRMHFVRSMYNETIQEEGFVIQSESNTNLPIKRLVTEIQGRKHISIPSRVAVIYRRQFYNGTYIRRQKRLTYIEKNGFYDPQGLTWSGAMANQRMADLLPFEYEPGM